MYNPIEILWDFFFCQEGQRSKGQRSSESAELTSFSISRKWLKLSWNLVHIMYVLPDSDSLINQRPDENDNNLLFNTEIALFLHTLKITQCINLWNGQSQVKVLKSPSTCSPIHPIKHRSRKVNIQYICDKHVILIFCQFCENVITHCPHVL